MSDKKLTAERVIEIINNEFAPPAFPKHYVRAEMDSDNIAIQIGSHRVDIDLDGKIFGSEKQTYSPWKPPERYPDDEMKGVWERRREERKERNHADNNPKH